MSFPAYASCKPSGIEWLGDIPEHWALAPLKRQTSILLSNVDKKSVVGQVPVRLCNYTDVYYQETIQPDTTFMRATATSEQVEKFTLREGDVLLTKDSEDPADIGVPAYVDIDMPGVLCGYHLAMLRPHAETNGAFIKRYIESGEARHYFHGRANGLTRYGLGKSALGELPITFPPLSEQRAIAAFLDRETLRIDRLIKKQERLIKLLEEKRQAEISHAVTKGLNPNAPMKDSGIEWLGKIPEHWSFSSFKHVCSKIIDCKNRTPDHDPNGEYFVVRTTCIKGGKFYSKGGYQTNLSNFIEWTKRGEPNDGDVLFTREAPTGEAAIAPSDLRFCLGQRMMCLRPNRNKVTQKFLLYCVYGPLVREMIGAKSKGSTVGHLRVEEIAGLPLLTPSIEEQIAITQHLEGVLGKLDQTQKKCSLAIKRLTEHRSALISAAVTGKIDVRGLIDIESEEAA